MSTLAGTVAADPDALQRYAAAGADLARRTAAEAHRLSLLTPPPDAPVHLGAPLGQLAGLRIPALTQTLQDSADLAGEVAVRLRRADASRGPRSTLPASWPTPARPVVGPREVSIDLDAWRATLTDAATRAVSIGRGVLAVAPQMAVRLAEVPALAPLTRLLAGPFGRIAPAAGMLLVGQDVLQLLQEGDPREAWRREGLSYAREVARTANDASLVALAEAPSPFTFALAAGSGLAWFDLVCLDNGWPVMLPPPFPSLPGNLSTHLRRLSEASDAMLPLAMEGLQGLQGLASHEAGDALGAVEAFRSHDLIEGGQRSLDTLTDLATDGGQLVTDLGTSALRVLLSI